VCHSDCLSGSCNNTSSGTRHGPQRANMITRRAIRNDEFRMTSDEFPKGYFHSPFVTHHPSFLICGAYPGFSMVGRV
jgi:hypothetical protein